MSDRKTLLQQIISDPASTSDEVVAAQRELNPQPSPQTQAQEDVLLENMLSCNFESNDPRYCDEIRILWYMLQSRIMSVCGDPEHIAILTALYGRTKSALVRDNVIAELRHLARYSPLDSIHQSAITFLADCDQILNYERRPYRPASESGPCIGCQLRHQFKTPN